MPYYVCDTKSIDKNCYEIHEKSCPYKPISKYSLDIGHHACCLEAIKYLENANNKQKFRFDGCFYCCQKCHVRRHHWRITSFKP